MKKLLLLISLLLATNAWGEVSALSCNSVASDSDIVDGPPLDHKKHGTVYQKSLLIDSKKKEVTFEGEGVFDYEEEGISITFTDGSEFRKGKTTSYSLDRVTGDLMERLWWWEKGEPELMLSILYHCKKVKPLF